MAIDFATNGNMFTVGTTPNIIQSGATTISRPRGPSFAAYHTTTQAQNTVLIFNQVVHNIGSYYNPATGIFTAQTKGIYHLRAQICVPLNVGDWRVYIPTTAGGQRQTIFYQGTTATYQALYVEAILSMNVNDYAYALYTGPAGVNIVNASTVNQFTGHMVV